MPVHVLQYMCDSSSAERALPVSTDTSHGTLGKACLYPYPSPATGHAQASVPV